MAGLPFEVRSWLINSIMYVSYAAIDSAGLLLALPAPLIDEPARAKGNVARSGVHSGKFWKVELRVVQLQTVFGWMNEYNSGWTTIARLQNSIRIGTQFARLDC